ASGGRYRFDGKRIRGRRGVRQEQRPEEGRLRVIRRLHQQSARSRRQYTYVASATFSQGKERRFGDGAKTTGTDGTVHAASGTTLFLGTWLRALGQFRQSPGFRSFARGWGVPVRNRGQRPMADDCSSVLSFRGLPWSTAYEPGTGNTRHRSPPATDFRRFALGSQPAASRRL